MDRLGKILPNYGMIAAMLPLIMHALLFRQNKDWFFAIANRPILQIPT
jgi:hypothetical protein